MMYTAARCVFPSLRNRIQILVLEVLPWKFCSDSISHSAHYASLDSLVAYVVGSDTRILIGWFGLLGFAYGFEKNDGLCVSIVFETRVRMSMMFLMQLF